MNKTHELARYLLGNSESLDFTGPTPTLVGGDSRKTRKRILALSGKEARELGISKSTLHYLRKHARADRPFEVYQKVAAKLG